MDEDKELNIWNQKVTNYIAIAIACVITVPLIVFLFSKCLPGTSGPVGDTIGGTTAPIIGLLSAILIYISFRAQIQANKIQLKANKEAREEANFKYLIEELDKFKKTIENYKSGLIDDSKMSFESLEHFADKIPNYFFGGINYEKDCITSLKQTKYLLISIENMLNEQKKLIISDVFKEILETKCWLYYLENLQTSLGKISNWNLNINKGKKAEKERIRKSETYQLSFEINAKTTTIIALFNSIQKEV